MKDILADNERRTILVTGGAGFIGSHVVRRLVERHPHHRFVNLDALTYAGNLANLQDVEGRPNYRFVKADLRKAEEVFAVFQEHAIDDVIHLAAESHVDRSISNPMAFVETNVVGTVQLLNAARTHWGEHLAAHRFYHISTDEVYGTLGATGYFTEETPYDPRSPYSASKASSDHFVRAYHHTFGMDVVLSNCSNNYGPYQFPEKLIPLMINNIRCGRPLPVYGQGENVRDWLYVEDHAEAIELIFRKGRSGETYNVGGNNEWRNIDLVYKLCSLMDEALQQAQGTSEALVSFVRDRAGHDHRYAIDAGKIRSALGWEPTTGFDTGLRKTIQWYLENLEWMERITSGAYQQYYLQQYGEA